MLREARSLRKSFERVFVGFGGKRAMTSAAFDSSKYDAEQVQMMQEMIPIVDANDNVIRAGTKVECHLNENISAGLLHRAFSVFLFNHENKLLLQQRSKAKITFPEFWANSCCSHPLHTEDELENTKENDFKGVKLAGIRKMEQELGIPKSFFKLEDLTFMTRIHYEAQEEGLWGEHEMDYALIAKKTFTESDIPYNENEVQQIKLLDEKEFREFMDGSKANGDKIAPWFGKIERQFLSNWWEAVRTGKVKEVTDQETIHRL